MPHFLRADALPADPATLRRLMRARRRALRPAAQRGAARRLCHAVTRDAGFVRARCIALYVAADGEIDPAPIARIAWHRGKQVCLPVLDARRPGTLEFRAWRRSDRLLSNRFGIPEPATGSRAVRPWQIDLVLLPLVAFDDAGNRLGMGGGYYDRTFAPGRMARWPRRPRLCGLAHRLQRVPQLPAKDWDVPLARVFAG